MATFADIAPTLASVGVTEEEAVTYFENHTPLPSPPTEPVTTKAKVVAVANLLFDGAHGLEVHGGVAGIAQTVGLTTAQTLVIVREIRDAFAQWRSGEL
jgi:hypothetical protein